MRPMRRILRKPSSPIVVPTTSIITRQLPPGIFNRRLDPNGIQKRIDASHKQPSPDGINGRLGSNSSSRSLDTPSIYTRLDLDVYRELDLSLGPDDIVDADGIVRRVTPGYVNRPAGSVNTRPDRDREQNHIKNAFRAIKSSKKVGFLHLLLPRRSTNHYPRQ
jgi:hypothetical protein